MIMSIPTFRSSIVSPLQRSVRRLLTIFIPLVMLLPSPAIAQYSQQSSVVGAGATEASAPGISLRGTAGEPAIGPIRSPVILLGGGFWYAATGAVPPFAMMNAAPLAADDSASTPRGTPIILDVLANDSDPDGDPLTVDDVSQPEHGTVDQRGGGILLYTPADGFTGAETFVYTIGDGNGGLAAAAVHVTVSAGPPVVASGDQLVPISLPLDESPLAMAMDVDPRTGVVYLSARLSAWAENDNGQSVRNDQLARWDGQWSALGSINEVYALLSAPDGLIIGGRFQRATRDLAGCDSLSHQSPSAGDYQLLKVARLLGPGPCAVNRHDWVYEQVGELSDGAPSFVRALAIDDAGRLYAGGKGEIGSGYNFAVFDGSWEGLGGGFIRSGSPTGAEINAVGVDPTTQSIYVGGSFDEVLQPDGSSLYTNGIASWNGKAWEAVGGGTCYSCSVSAIAFATNGDLIIAGRFPSVLDEDDQAVRVNHVARWDGASWGAFGGGATAAVGGRGLIDIEVDDERESIYVAGTFREVENPDGTSITSSGVARWDLSSNTWHALGNGLVETESGVALGRLDCSLYVATNGADQHLYAYDACSVGSSQTATVDPPNVPNRTQLHEAFPNPFNPTTNVRYELDRQMHVRLSVFDILGREVLVLVDGLRTAGSHEAVFVAERLPSGTYLIRLVGRDVVEVSSVLLTK